ncbi:hypothetical protein Cci01nite_82380 [Catellatospora citrea]|uniref:Uncharacterized protein n=1 Tax=Catellatospora citrea TaxID=53366 RepID=A0A8J3KWC6_9ACTN|nr:hypothetical protein Cci01nite_82380 [Catellatospora citrea]
MRRPATGTVAAAADVGTAIMPNPIAPIRSVVLFHFMPGSSPENVRNPLETDMDIFFTASATGRRVTPMPALPAQGRSLCAKSRQAQAADQGQRAGT